MTPPHPPSEGGVPEPSGTGRAWVRIDLEAIASNARFLRSRIAPAELVAVVKADAYGHVAAAVGPALERAGVGWFAVASATEGIALRDAGVQAEILVLGPVAEQECPRALAYRLVPVVSSFEELERWERAAGDGEVEAHLKVDTGMGRLGFDPRELPGALERVRSGRGVRMTGFLTHLARAEELEIPFSREQTAAFDRAIELLTPEERGRVRIHWGNSAAALHAARLGVDSTPVGLVRCGLALYGLDPARRLSELRPAMSVHARVGRLRELPAGHPVGYGGTWVSRRASRLAVLPVGYADGYPLALSNRAEVLIRGARAPVAGRVSMDMTVVDVTDVPGVRVGDEAVLLGAQESERITAWELAERAGSIPWEILCGFKMRLPRLYEPR